MKPLRMILLICRSVEAALAFEIGGESDGNSTNDHEIIHEYDQKWDACAAVDVEGKLKRCTSRLDVV